MKLGKNDILVIEGLHALNDRVLDNIPRKNKFKIYVSPLTYLNIDNDNRISMTDIRLLRRMVRDNRTRGASATDTLKMWKKVREIEEEICKLSETGQSTIADNIRGMIEIKFLTVPDEARNYKFTKEFIQFCSQRMITLEDVINENYKDIDIEELNIAEKHATIMCLLQVEKDNIEKVREFVKKLGSEYVAVFDKMWTHGDENRLEIIAEQKLKKIYIRNIAEQKLKKIYIRNKYNM